MSEVRRRAQDAVEELTEDGELEEFSVNETDFLSARERGGATGTRIDQSTAKLSEASEIANRSFLERGSSGQFTNVVYPVVIPERQSLFWRVLPIGLLAVFIAVGLLSVGLGALPGIGGLALAVAGPHLWLLFALLALFPGGGRVWSWCRMGVRL